MTGGDNKPQRPTDAGPEWYTNPVCEACGHDAYSHDAYCHRLGTFLGLQDCKKQECQCPGFVSQVYDAIGAYDLSGALADWKSLRDRYVNGELNGGGDSDKKALECLDILTDLLAMKSEYMFMLMNDYRKHRAGGPKV